MQLDAFDTWAECADAIEELVSYESAAPEGSSLDEQKLALLAFGPHLLAPTDRRTAAQLKGKPRHDGPYRHEANIEHVSLLVIDVDRIADLDELGQRLEDSKRNAILYASPSDTPEARRVRVVAPVSRPILVSECYRTRQAFAESLGLAPGCGVEGAIDAAKLFFCGRLHGTASRDFWRFGA